MTHHCVRKLIYDSPLMYVTHMVKLIFRSINKTNKTFLYKFFSYIYVNVDTILSKNQKENDNKKNKTKKGFEKRLMKGIKIFLRKKKSKSENMVVNNIEIFLKQKKKIINIFVSNVEIFQKMKK